MSEFSFTPRRRAMLPHFAEKIGNGTFSCLIHGRARIDSKAHRAWDHIDCARVNIKLSHRRDYITVAESVSLNGQHHLGRRSQRIGTKLHGNCTGCPDAVHLNHKSCRATNGGHDADRKIIRLQHRTLLDMQLKIGENVLWLTGHGGDALWIASKLPEIALVIQGNPIFIAAH